MSQYEGDDLVELGLLKMDFLGLRTLSVIQRAIDNIKRHKGIDLDLDCIELNDENTFKLLRNAESIGVFQIESPGFQDLLRKLSISCFEDIIALVALYRPGVMASGMTDEFIERKKDPKKIKYPHPALKVLLSGTYGVILYQEQVMQVARKLAGFSPSQADDMRKAMSKKIPETLQKLRESFIGGAVENNINKSEAADIFDTLSKFGAYGFNKSHSAAYGKITYQTAYLKANYPAEYMCALLTCEMHNTDKVAEYVAEAERMGIKIEKPSVLKSGVEFLIEGEGIIRYGLKAIKNIGEAAIESIINARNKDGEFKTFYDFCSRVDLQKVNKRVVENLIKAGAFDFLEKGRRPLISAIDAAMSLAAAHQKDIRIGQTSFFDVFDGGDIPEVEITDDKRWHENEMLVNEKEALGFYFSGHPLTKYAKEISKLTSGNIEYVKDKITSGTDVIIGGMVKHKKKLKTRSGDEMMAFMLEDLTDTMEAIIFPSAYTAEIGSMINEDALIVIIGKIEENRGRRQCVVEKIIPLDEARIKLVGKIILRLNSIGVGKEEITKLKNILDKYPGDIVVEFEIKTKKYDKIKISTSTKARVSDSLLEELAKTIGKESISLIGKGVSCED